MLAHLGALGRHVGPLGRHLAPLARHVLANMSKNVPKSSKTAPQMPQTPLGTSSLSEDMAEAGERKGASRTKKVPALPDRHAGRANTAPASRCPYSVDPPLRDQAQVG